MKTSKSKKSPDKFNLEYTISGMPICLQVDNGNAFTSEVILHKLVKEGKDQCKSRFVICDNGVRSNDT
jgi:hypothetical protein